VHLITIEAHNELTASRCQLLRAGPSRIIAERPLNISCQRFPLIAEFNKGFPRKVFEARPPHLTESVVGSLPVVVALFHVRDLQNLTKRSERAPRLKPRR